MSAEIKEESFSMKLPTISFFVEKLGLTQEQFLTADFNKVWLDEEVLKSGLTAKKFSEKFQFLRMLCKPINKEVIDLEDGVSSFLDNIPDKKRGENENQDQKKRQLQQDKSSLADLANKRRKLSTEEDELKKEFDHKQQKIANDQKVLDDMEKAHEELPVIELATSHTYSPKLVLLRNMDAEELMTTREMKKKIKHLELSLMFEKFQRPENKFNDKRTESKNDKWMLKYTTEVSQLKMEKVKLQRQLDKFKLNRQLIIDSLSETEFKAMFEQIPSLTTPTFPTPSTALNPILIVEDDEGVRHSSSLSLLSLPSVSIKKATAAAAATTTVTPVTSDPEWPKLWLDPPDEDKKEGQDEKKTAGDVQTAKSTLSLELGTCQDHLGEVNKKILAKLRRIKKMGSGLGNRDLTIKAIEKLRKEVHLINSFSFSD